MSRKLTPSIIVMTFLFCLQISSVNSKAPPPVSGNEARGLPRGSMFPIYTIDTPQKETPVVANNTIRDE